jgi:hypothetical protein
VHVRVAVWSSLFVSALLVEAGGCSSSSNGNATLFNGDGTTVGPPPDSASLPGDASACRPGDVETYRPAPYRPATAAHKGVCTPKDIRDFYDFCLGPQKTSASCNTFMSDKTTGTGACAACIITLEAADHYGPVIDHGGFVTPNVAGCIELTDYSNAYACAKSVQALSGCELAACEANCPVHDTASRAAYDACAAQAAQGGCQNYAMAANCAELLQDAGEVALCLLPIFQDFYNAVVPLFCGAPPLRSDAASLYFDAGEDATASDAWTEASPSVGDASSDALRDAEADATVDAPKD